MNSESDVKNVDTRCDWTVFMFVSKCRYNVFRKQRTTDVCKASFRELEAFSFKLGEIGFGGTHTHLKVDVPKKYSKLVAEIMLKRHSAARIFRNTEFQEEASERQFLVWL